MVAVVVVAVVAVVAVARMHHLHPTTKPHEAAVSVPQPVGLVASSQPSIQVARFPPYALARELVS